MRYTFTIPDSVDTNNLISNLENIKTRYHSFYFDNGMTVRGDYDIGSTIEEYPFDKLSGLKVLDVGIGGGWFSLYFKLHGADVTAFDARGLLDHDVYGRYQKRKLEDEKPTPDRYGKDGQPIYHNRTSETFFVLQEALDLDIPFNSGSVYDLDTIFEGQEFDLIFFGSILLHLRDPIGALMAARRLCRGKLIADSNINLDNTSKTPSIMMPYTSFSKRAWWVPNLEAYRHWFLAAGFNSVDVDQQVNIKSDITRDHISGSDHKANPDQIHQVAIAHI